MKTGQDMAIWDKTRLRLAIDAAGVALWSWNVDTDKFSTDERGSELWGTEPGCEICFEDLSAKIHPADRDRVRAAFAATRGIVGAYEIDFRILIGDEVRWVSARGRGSDEGIVDRMMFGIFLDVTGRKQAEEGNELLAGEMSHRVKNLLAIASGLTRLAQRSTANTVDMARELTGSLSALGRAHDLVRPLPGQHGRAALLGDLFSILLAPYDDLGAFAGRVRVSVARMGVGEHAATALALVIHELATNSLKYGAFSSDAGTLDVASRVEDDDVVITWTERGGPMVETPETKAGFGSSMVQQSMTARLGGSIAHEWSAEGLIVTLRARMSRLAH